jgi:hypothetical protein
MVALKGTTTTSSGEPMGLFNKKAQRPTLTAEGWLMPANATPAMNEGPGTYDYNVVGESNYNANLRAILREEGIDVNGGGEFQTGAYLLCEPKNKFDPNAVAVVISGKRVGYIPKEDARLLSPQLQDMVATGQLLYVKAVIGWRDPAVIGVRLDISVG